MRVYQITDLHVPEQGAPAEFDHVKSNIKQQLDFIERETPDLLVISGDLSMTDHSVEACEWLKQHIPDVPTVVIPGNHDDPSLVRQYFVDWQRTHEYDHCAILFLDSSACELDQVQLDRLKTFRTKKHGVLFVHHPVCPLGDGFMSRSQALDNLDEANRVVGDSQIDHVFCGHFHNEAHVQANGFKLYLTPSPAFQVSMQHTEFQREPCQPGVRVIEINGTGVSSRVVYLDSAVT